MRRLIVKWLKWRAKRQNKIAKRRIGKAMELARRAERLIGEGR